MRFTQVSQAMRFLKILGPHESNQKWPRVNGDSAVNGDFCAHRLRHARGSLHSSCRLDDGICGSPPPSFRGTAQR